MPQPNGVTIRSIRTCRHAVGGHMTIRVGANQPQKLPGEASRHPFVFHHGKSGVGFMIGLHLPCATRRAPGLGIDWDPAWFAQIGLA